MVNKRDARNNHILLMFNWKLKKAYESIFQEISEEFELTQNEIDVLLFLKNNAPLDTSSDIVKYRSISKSMISRSVDSLHTKGYLSLERDELDKRCIHLKIESSAEPIVEKLSNIQKDFFRSITEDITEEEYRAMERVLNKVYEKLIKNFNE